MSELEANISYSRFDTHIPEFKPARSFKEWLFEIRPYEKSGKVYELVGIKQFNKLYLNTFGAITDKIHKGNVHGLKSYSTEYLKGEVEETKNLELLHYASYLAFLPIFAYAKDNILAINAVFVADILLNKYPAMLQRYKRNRLEIVLEHRENRGASK